MKPTPVMPQIHPASASTPVNSASIEPMNATGPLVCVAGQRDLGGQVGRDQRPDHEHRGGEQQGPHERSARGEVAGAETGEHRGGGADRRETDGERREPAD